jgi:hypothetical protein
MTAESERDIQRLTPDEAVAALTAAAWTESISGERYGRAVEVVQAMTAEGDPDLDPMIPASRIRAAVAEALGEQQTLIHCFMGSMGADWSLEGAIELARRDGAQCAWAPNMFRHELAVYAGGEMHRFDARRPADTTEGE